MDVIEISLQNINKAEITNKIKQIYNENKLMVYPTDTLYGLGANPYNKESTTYINEIKGRKITQEISVAVPDLDTLKQIAQINSIVEKTYFEFLPGPITLVLNAGVNAPEGVITSKGTIGIRIPDNQLTLELLKITGPLTATSANRHEGPEPIDIVTAKKQLGDSVDLYLDCGPCEIKRPSTILDLSSDEPIVLREGVVSRSELEHTLGCKVVVNG